MRPLLHPFWSMGDPAIRRSMSRRCLKSARSCLISAISRICRRARFSALNTSLFRTHTSTTLSASTDLLRIAVGREKAIRLYGPRASSHMSITSLLAYRWNLVDRFVFDLVFVVDGNRPRSWSRTAQLGSRLHLQLRRLVKAIPSRWPLHAEPPFRVSTAVFSSSHAMPCLRDGGDGARQCLEEPARELGLPVGPWLRDSTRASRGQAGRLSDSRSPRSSKASNPKATPLGSCALRRRSRRGKRSVT